MRRAPLCAALAALVVVVGTVGIRRRRGRAAGRRRQLGPGAHQRLPRPEHPRNAAASTTASPPRTSPRRPDHQHPGVDVARRRQLDAHGHRCPPHVASWAKAGDTWAPSVAYDSAATTSSCTTRRRRPPRATSASAWPRPSCPPAPTPTPARRRSSATTASIRRRPPSTAATGGSIDPDIFTDRRRQFLPASGRATGTTWAVSTPIMVGAADREPPADRPASRPRSCGTTSPGRAASSRGPTWSTDPSGNNPRRQLLPLLLRQRRGRDDLRHRVGQLPVGPDVPPARDVHDGQPCSARPRACRDPEGPDVYTLPRASSSWPSPPGRARPSATSAAAPTHVPGRRSPSPRRGGAPSLAPATNDRRRPPARLPGIAAPAPGYWQVGSDGGIFTFGSAQFYGSTGSIQLNKPVVGMAATPDGRGYWLVASDGGVFAYGDAQFYGSTGSIVLNKPIIGMIPTLDGRGLLADRQRRRRVRLRRREVLRVGRRRQPRLPRHRGGARLPRWRLLDGRRQRPGLQLRRHPLRGSARPRRPAGTASPAWRARRTRTGTGWPARTATSPTSATPRPTAP